jgi:hypothetical protein
MDDTLSTNLKHFNRKNSSMHKFQHQHQIIIDNMNNENENANINNNNENLHNLHQFRANRTSSTSDVIRMHKNQQDYVKHRLEIGEIFAKKLLFFSFSIIFFIHFLFDFSKYFDMYD